MLVGVSITMKFLRRLAVFVAVLTTALVVTTLLLTFAYEEGGAYQYPTLRESMLRLKPGEYSTLPQELAQQTLTATEECSFQDIEQIAYWQPSVREDEQWVSPYAKIGPKDKYVVFEPDEGGWNNLSKFRAA